jgi:hypothetical protein
MEKWEPLSLRRKFETMDLIAHLPKAVDLNSSKLKEQDGKFTLSLGISHVVTGSIATTERVGSADIVYNLDFSKETNLPVGLDTSSKVFIGVQSMDFIHQQLQQLRPRTAYSVEHVTNGKFDFRAFLFVLGASFAGGAAQRPVTFSSRPAGYRTLNTGWMVPDVGDVTLGPNLAQNANQFVTLLSLLGEAGVDNATFLSDYVPGTTGNLLTGRGLSKFALRVAMNVLNSAQECLCFGSHFVAFYCGMTSVITLNAHTDEGGWIRKLFRSVQYPKSTGIVAGMGREFMGYPLQESVPQEECLRIVVGLYLSTSALIHPADVLVNGRTSVYERTEPQTNRISDYGTLTIDIVSVLHKWRDLICDMYGQHHDANDDSSSYYEYLRNPRADRHADVDYFIPFFWVEPSPLLVMDIAGYEKPASLTRIVKLPLFKSTNVSHTGYAVDSKGRIPPYSEVWVERSPCTFREEGASYLLSSVYSPDNGLSQFQLVDGLDGRGAPTIGFVDPGNVNLANMRWQTPHNPMPCPLEGYSSDTTVFKMYSAGIKLDPTPAELFTGQVESRLSAFFVKEDVSKVPGVTHRHVPAHIKRALNVSGEDFNAIRTLKVISLTSTYTPAPESVVPVAPDTVGVKTSATETASPDIPEPPSSTQNVIPSDSGIKPVLPSVKTPGLNDGKSTNGD